MQKDYDYFLKIVLIGDEHVGKTSLFEAFKGNQLKEAYYPSYGVGMIEKTMVQKERVRLQLLDTSGNRRFRSMESYFKNGDAIILVYDVTEKETFDFLKHQLEDFVRLRIRDRPIVVLGNKNDLQAKIESNRVDSNLVEKFCKEQNLIFLQGNAKSSICIDQAITSLINELVSRKKAQQQQVDMDKKSNFIIDAITQIFYSKKKEIQKESQQKLSQNQDGNLKQENDILKEENKRLKDENLTLKSNFKQVFEMFEKEVLRLKLEISEAEGRQKK